MTVSRLKQELTLEEYFGWAEYLKQEQGEKPEKKSVQESFAQFATPYKGG